MSDLPPWFGKKREEVNRRSKEQERRYAQDHQGRVTAGSGSSWRAPEDIVEKDDLTQIKFTDKEGFRFTVKEWKKLRGNAQRQGREPKLVIDFEQHGIRLVVREEPHPGRRRRRDRG